MYFLQLKNITGQIEVLVVKNKYTDFMPVSESIKEGKNGYSKIYLDLYHGCNFEAYISLHYCYPFST